jgi:hypothetical protein
VRGAIALEIALRIDGLGVDRGDIGDRLLVRSAGGALLGLRLLQLRLRLRLIGERRIEPRARTLLRDRPLP